MAGVGKQVKKIMSRASDRKQQDPEAVELSIRSRNGSTVRPTIRGGSLSSLSRFMSRALSRSMLVSAHSGTSPQLSQGRRLPSSLRVGKSSVGSQMKSALSWATPKPSDPCVMGSDAVKVEVIQGASRCLMTMT